MSEPLKKVISKELKSNNRAELIVQDTEGGFLSIQVRPKCIDKIITVNENQYVCIHYRNELSEKTNTKTKKINRFTVSILIDIKCIK